MKATTNKSLILLFYAIMQWLAGHLCWAKQGILSITPNNRACIKIIFLLIEMKDELMESGWVKKNMLQHLLAAVQELLTLSPFTFCLRRNWKLQNCFEKMPDIYIYLYSSVPWTLDFSLLHTYHVNLTWWNELLSVNSLVNVNLSGFT